MNAGSKKKLKRLLYFYDNRLFKWKFYYNIRTVRIRNVIVIDELCVPHLWLNLQRQEIANSRSRTSKNVFYIVRTTTRTNTKFFILLYHECNAIIFTFKI